MLALMDTEQIDCSDPARDEVVSLRPATPDDEDFLFQVFADTRAPEFNLIDLEAAQKHALITMQFNAQRYQYDASYPQASSKIILCENHPIGRMLVDVGECEITLVDIALLPGRLNMLRDFRQLRVDCFCLASMNLKRGIQVPGKYVMLQVIHHTWTSLV